VTKFALRSPATHRPAFRRGEARFEYWLGERRAQDKSERFVLRRYLSLLLARPPPADGSKLDAGHNLRVEKAAVIDRTVEADWDHSTAGAAHTAAATDMAVDWDCNSAAAVDTAVDWDCGSAAAADTAADWNSSWDSGSGCRSDHMNLGRRAAARGPVRRNNPDRSRSFGRKNTQGRKRSLGRRHTHRRDTHRKRQNPSRGPHRNIRGSLIARKKERCSRDWSNRGQPSIGVG
jgi:hypothetical protein